MTTSDSDIFECQSEPIFLAKASNISSDLLEDWLFILASENYETMQKKSNMAFGHFKDGVVVEFIFGICDQFHLPPEVKYHTVELFDLFMFKHIALLLNYAREHCEPDHNRPKYWAKIMERVKRQLVLRILSCIQISSKLHCHSRAISVSRILLSLKKAGYTYSIKSVINSELRVLTEVEYRVNLTTPLVYLETLLEALGRNDSRINVKSLYDVGINVLNVVYVDRNNIFEQLFKRITNKDFVDPNTDLPKLNVVKEDALFLATAIIACSAYILDQCTFVGIVDQLHFMTRIHRDEIMDFTIVLITEILHQEV